MPKNIIPPAILSFVRQSNSAESGDDGDDRALLIPSSGSSFNLTGDSEYLLPKSTSHHSANSRSSRGATSNASSSSGSGHRHHHHHHHRRLSSGGGGGKAKRKKRSSPKSLSNSRAASAPRDMNMNERSSPTKFHNPPAQRRSSTGDDHRQIIDPMSSSAREARAKKHSKSTPLMSSGQEDDDYLVGCDSDSRGLSPIHSTSFNSDNSNSNSAMNSSNHSIPPMGAPEIDWSTQSLNKSPSTRTIHSGKSYKSQKSSNTGTGSKRQSRKSLRRGSTRSKLRREGKRREWLKRWRRRRLLGTVILTVIYSLLFAYTLLVTLGPLYLHFWDADFWCPYYHEDYEQHYWEEGHNVNHHSGYSLNIDQLQQSRQRQQKQKQQQQQKQQWVGDDEHQRRRLTSHGVEFETMQDLKKVELDLLRKTSKDVHSNNGKDGNDNDQNDGADSGESPYENPDYDDTPCHITRIPLLFYLTLEECDLSRRLAASVLLGGFIGYERRASDRPAGIRTMALVSLGSCFFTISSQLAFRDSPMTWDASRVTAAIPSGVGFLGAGLIWKGSLSDGSGGEVHQVHGITTAASVWLAAAMGVGAGGALYAVAAYSTALVILVLRFGPRLYLQNDRGFDYDDDEDEEDDDEIVDDDSADNNEMYDNFPEDRIPAQSSEKSRITHRNNYEMHEITDQSKKDTSTLKNKTAGYGATDIEQNMVGQLLQEDQKRQIERMNQLGGNGTSNSGLPFLSWLTKLVPGKERKQPLNPYQEISRDREVMRLMKKKKSLGRMSSRPSFCT